MFPQAIPMHLLLPGRKRQPLHLGKPAKLAPPPTPSNRLMQQDNGAVIASDNVRGGVGKSALRLVQYISLALGRPLCGQHVFRRCRVLLISLEDDRDEVQRRIQAVLDHFDLPRSDLKGWLFCANPKRSKLVELKHRERAIGPLEQQIRDAIARRKPDLVALDPFVKLHSLGENDSGDMNFVCELLTSIAVDDKIAIDIPHHVQKGQLTPGDADSARGSSGIRDAGRLIFTLTPMSEGEAKAFNIDLDDPPWLRPARQCQGQHRCPIRRRDVVPSHRCADRQRQRALS
jgi:RecA-family ATPase